LSGHRGPGVPVSADETGERQGPDDEADERDRRPGWVVCPSCEGTGRAGGRPCVLCAGSGQLSPAVAEDPAADDTEELEIQPGGDG
jgi:hypothetical protein